MEARREDHAPNIPRSQGGKKAFSPRVVVELLDLGEIYERWGFGEDRIYRAVAQGRLHAYGRPHRQKYYSAAELVKCFGEPPNGAPLNSIRRERDTKGGYHQWPEFEFERREDAA